LKALEREREVTCMWSSHNVRPTRAEPADSFLKSAPQSLSATLQLIDISNKEL